MLNENSCKDSEVIRYTKEDTDHGRYQMKLKPSTQKKRNLYEDVSHSTQM